MATAGGMLDATWVLWGMLELNGSTHVVRAQLVKSADPNIRRTVNFTYSTQSELAAAVPRTWQQLSSTSE